MNNDLLHVRYRGILTYRGLRLIAMILMTLSQTASILVPAHKLCQAYQLTSIVSDGAIRFFEVMAGMGQASFALIMISSVGLVFSRQVSLKKLLIEYFVLALITYLVTVFVLSWIIRDTLYGIPSEVVYFREIMKNLDLPDVTKGLLNRTLSLVMPGDGTVHPEVLSDICGAFGFTIQVPDMETLISRIPDGVINLDALRSMISGIASQDLTPYVNSTVDSISDFIGNKTPELISYIEANTMPKVESMIVSAMNFNVFWNMFLYTLFYFFASYHPKKLSAGKLMLFRCCAVIPGGWMLISYVVSRQIHIINTFTPPLWLVASLSNIKPSVMALFFLLVVFEKYNELEFKSNPKYQGMRIGDYFGSRMASLQFSIGTSALVAVISLADWLLGMIRVLKSWQFGQATMIWTCIPFLLLYSFNKRPKHKLLNGIIPMYYFAHYTWIILFALSVICITIGYISGTVPGPWQIF